MWAFPPVALLFCAATGGFDVNAGVVAETRVGEAPLQTGGAPRAGFVAVLTPGIEAQYLLRDFELRLAYGPRIFWRQPNELGSLRPLILHTATLRAVARPSRTVRLTGNGMLDVGSADYTSLNLALGAGAATSAQLPTKVLDLLSVSIEEGIEVLASRTLVLGITGRVIHRRPLGPVGAPTPGSLIRQTTVGAGPFVLQHVSRITDATLAVPASRTVYDDGTSVLTVSPQLEVRSRFSRAWDVRAAAGFAGSRLSTSAGVVAQWSPVGGIEGNVVWLSRNETAVRLTLGASAEQYVDPILQAVGPRGTALVRLSLLLSPLWACGLEGGFATSLSAKPLPPYPMSTLIIDETLVYASLPIRYRASDELIVEFGGRWFDRAPHLASPNFEFHQRQLWFYVTLSGTTRRQPSWRAP